MPRAEITVKYSEIVTAAFWLFILFVNITVNDTFMS